MIAPRAAEDAEALGRIRADPTRFAEQPPAKSRLLVAPRAAEDAAERRAAEAQRKDVELAEAIAQRDAGIAILSLCIVEGTQFDKV